MSRPKLMGYTKKVNVLLSDDVYEALRIKAFEDRSNPTEIVRKAVERYLSENEV